jgi:hypothetical protein
MLACIFVGFWWFFVPCKTSLAHCWFWHAGSASWFRKSASSINCGMNLRFCSSMYKHACIHVWNHACTHSCMNTHMHAFMYDWVCLSLAFPFQTRLPLFLTYSKCNCLVRPYSQPLFFLSIIDPRFVLYLVFHLSRQAYFSLILCASFLPLCKFPFFYLFGHS